VSLINDALRKARQAAAEHESRQPESVFRAPTAYPSRGPRRRGGAVLLVLVAATAGLSGAALVWWTLDKDEPAVTVASLAAAAATHETTEESQAASVPSQTERPPADPGAAIDSPVPPAIDIVPPQEEAVEGAATGTNTVPDEHMAQTAAVPPSRAIPPLGEPLAHEGPADGERVYVLEANLGYASLSLGFIVSRSVNPFAEINDIEVYEGSEVAGFVVERIEADRIILRDDRGMLVLQVR